MEAVSYQTASGEVLNVDDNGDVYQKGVNTGTAFIAVGATPAVTVWGRQSQCG